ncbi:phospholipase B1, membrane-associated-like [Diaphorina citri]|uniref:Phospholipase B1, membrane-associated-like n=1 Tax=Diaphorina citri TaxID=121845 RepID=A0A3Q0JLG4_DIACI|nr:phospholipase B1, membrane-associated-like [Diaphorina citri]
MRPVTLLWLSLHLLAQFGHSRRDKVNENLAWFWRLPDTDLPRSEQFNYVPRFLRISEESEHRFRTTFLHHVFGLTSNNKKRLREAKQAKKVQPHYEGPFPCDLSQARSPLPPNNVNQLRPGDIDIVGAIGDSITAGNGIVATNPSQVNTENRGLSWSVVEPKRPLYER